MSNLVVLCLCLVVALLLTAFAIYKFSTTKSKSDTARDVNLKVFSLIFAILLMADIFLVIMIASYSDDETKP